jgi:hypothetical protein
MSSSIHRANLTLEHERVAQLVEHRPFKALVLGSSPSPLTTTPKNLSRPAFASTWTLTERYIPHGEAPNLRSGLQMGGRRLALTIDRPAHPPPSGSAGEEPNTCLARPNSQTIHKNFFVRAVPE